MTQALHAKPENKPSTLGAAAAAAATGGTPAVSTAVVPGAHGSPAGAKPDEKPADPQATGGTVAAAPAKKNASKIFVASGQVYEFETAAKAEKFLNGGGDVPAPAEYSVFRGKRIGTSKKVSLR